MASARQLPHTSLYQRSELTRSHALVDSALKMLKVSSRQLQTILSTLRNELQILERLYYKGKNQHRAALFWRRVCEVRRCGDRISRSQPDTLVENLRRSFWGPLDEQNPKMLKGAWTHFPDINLVLDVNKRLSVLHLLCNKSLERIAKAFQHFSLCMQSGAFIQLMLTLYAISARAHSLITELDGAVDDCRRAFSTVIEVLRGPSPFPQGKILENVDTTAASVSEISEFLSTDEPICASDSTTPSQSTLPENTKSLNSDILFEPRTSIPIDISRGQGKSKKLPRDTKRNHKKHKKDEIDEIFNF